ncbi:hypothetical protein KVV02_004680 [Mortierella alpina]|uniref:Exosome complex protein n=1 Tax=Mortierella alpina TaxID=64518 RepID=A0A9P8A9L2_MORAP|nr:hypothetical protein KVV02_004680 [Mortierella alpina]
MPPKNDAVSLTDNHKNATKALLVTLAELEGMLAPLFATPSSLTETLAKLDSEKRCQLELLMAYAINTLAFINLKTNGTAPNTHPVMKELKRVKDYTEKLRHAIHGNKPNMEVDKDAATRFIRGALAANEVANRKEAEEARHQLEEDGAIIESQGTHKRFDAEPSLASSSSSPSSASAAAAATGAQSSTASSSSTQRKRMDPFQGYTDGKKKSKA